VRQGSGDARPGWHAVEAALEHQPEQVLRVWVQHGREDKRSQQVLALIQSLGIPVETVPKAVLDRYAQHHQGVIAWLRDQSLPGEHELMSLLHDLEHPPFLLILDGVQDPHNLGACLRTADAAGVDAVILPKHGAVSITPAVRKVACGAAETVPTFQVTNLARTLEQLKADGIWITGLALDEKAQPIDVLDWSGAVAIVMGAEESGLRPLTLKHCDRLAIIPMHGHVQSLNVSVATGVVLFNALRSRHSAK
jgi:23S rRNA (guanosine2251-2'-O)-methyltransferase